MEVSNSHEPDNANNRAQWANRYLTSSHMLVDYVAEKFRISYLHLNAAEEALLKAESIHAELVGHAALFTDVQDRLAFEEGLHGLRVKLDKCKVRPGV